MPLETNIEYRKRLMFNRIIRQQQRKLTEVDKSAMKVVERLCHNLTAPRNFSTLNRTISWVDRYFEGESWATQQYLREFLETCLIIYEQYGGYMKVIQELKNELRAKGKSEEEIQETIERGH
jgi:cysteinyl-tRNA synthetase